MTNRSNEHLGNHRIPGDVSHGEKMPVIRPLSLRKNFSWTLLGNVVYYLCQWGILSCLNKMEGTNASGIFILGLSISSPIYIFLEFHLKSLLATDVKERFRFECYFGSRLFSIFVSQVLVVVIAISCYSDMEKRLIIVFLGVAFGAQALGDIFYGLFQKYERLDITSHSNMIKGISNVTITIIIFWLTRSVLIVVFGLIISRFGVWLFYDYRKAKQLLMEYCGELNYKLLPDFSWKPQLTLAWMGLPLGITAWCVSMNANIPRYFLAERELGIFGSMAYVTTVGWMIITALSQSASPRLAKSIASGSVRNYLKLMTKLTLFGGFIGFCCVMGTWLAGPILLRILYTEEFVQYNFLFVIIIFSAAISYAATFMRHGVIAARILFIQPFLYSFITLAVLVTCYYCIPKYGFYGAAYAMVVASTFQFLFAVLLNICVVRIMIKRQ